MINEEEEEEEEEEERMKENVVSYHQLESLASSFPVISLLT